MTQLRILYDSSKYTLGAAVFYIIYKTLERQKEGYEG